MDREALRTHSKTLIYLFVIIYVLLTFVSFVFPCFVCFRKEEKWCGMKDGREKTLSGGVNEW